MKTLKARVNELKRELASDAQSSMVFLLDPKDLKPLKAVAAWQSLPRVEAETIMVEDDATLAELWKITPPNFLAFSVAMGCSVKEAQVRMTQLQQLGLVYPDGSTLEVALTLVKIYINNQIGKIRQESRKVKDEEDE